MPVEAVTLKSLIEYAAKGGALGHVNVRPDQIVCWTATTGQPRRPQARPIDAETYSSLCADLEVACGGSRTTSEIVDDLPQGLAGVVVRWDLNSLEGIHLTLVGALPA
jgi:hypothetical protein